MALDRICIDTSAYSQFRRGDPAVVRLMDSAGSVAVPVIVLGELRAGFRIGRMSATNEEELDDFLSEPVVDVLAAPTEASHHYADIVADLRESGTPLPTNDVWIAAIAAGSGAIVVTYDQHFRSISRVGSVVLSSGG